MNCYNLYQEYLNQLVEIKFVRDSDAYKEYGERLVGHFYYPIESDASFFATENSKEVAQGQLVKLCFKIMPRFKLKYSISDEIDDALVTKGFLCGEVEKVQSYNDIELLVSGNINANINGKTINAQSYGVSGIWTYIQDMTKVKVTLNGYQSMYLSGDKFYSLCNKIRGCNYDEVANFLNEERIHIDLNPINYLEVDLIKALSNIFIWLEYYFIDGDIAPETENLVSNQVFLPKMFDEFIVDLNSQNESQKDIYLLKQSYKWPNNLPLLEELMTKNLLAKVRLKIRGEIYENYFVPFIKWNHDLTHDSQLANLYLSIMRDRDLCIKKHFNS